MTKSQIFLSASIPIPGREPFDQDIQTRRIRNSVLALVNVCRDLDLVLVFGGHPAISPLVHHAADNLGVIGNIYIYQSEFYRNRIPEAARKFPNLNWTSAGKDDASSQAAMRNEMINPGKWQYEAAVFIGGMEGIFVEAELFEKHFTGKPRFPLAMTGGATQMLRDKIPQDELTPHQWRLLNSEVYAKSMPRYRRLLAELLGTALTPG